MKEKALDKKGFLSYNNEKLKDNKAKWGIKENLAESQKGMDRKEVRK